MGYRWSASIGGAERGGEVGDAAVLDGEGIREGAIIAATATSGDNVEVVDSDDKSLLKEKGQKRRHKSEDEVDVVHGSRTTEEQYSFAQMDLGLRRAVFPVYVTQKHTYIENLWVGISRRAMRTATRAEGRNRGSPLCIERWRYQRGHCRKRKNRWN